MVRINGIPDQVVRLAILFGAALAALLAVRARLVPDTFGDLGHYRAAAVDSAAALPIHYAGLATCVDCHSDVGEVKAASYHRGLSCETCHGAAADHAEDPDVRMPHLPRERAECLFCHEYLPSRPTGFPQVMERAHHPTQPCIECHSPHDPTPPTVPDACSACHTAIERTKAVSPHAPLSCETCHEVDPAHRVLPRAHLPRKPTDREFCGGCHAPGAAAAPTVPRVDLASHGGRLLCWQCHYPHDPVGS